MAKISRFFSLASLLLVACTTAPQKPSEWKVKATTESNQRIWVTKADGSRQCDKKTKALRPDQAAAQLKNAGVIVFDAKAGNDGMMRAQKCGNSTGGTVDVQISRVDLQKALSQGFVTKTTASE